MKIGVNGRIDGENNDCTVIALSMACKISYVDAHGIVKSKGRRNKRGFYTPKIFDKNKAFKEKHTYVFAGKTFKVVRYPRPGMTVKTFAKLHPKGTFIMRISGHAFTIRNGVVYDCCRENARVKEYYRITK